MAPQETVRQAPGGAGLSAAEVRLLATMPLHAITAVYGEDGLRERLLIDAGRFPGADRTRIEAALALMSRLHELDRRQREPYACHPLRVTIRVLSHYRVTARTWRARAAARHCRGPRRGHRPQRQSTGRARGTGRPVRRAHRRTGR